MNISNEQLVEYIRNDDWYKKYYCPEYDRVLEEGMLRVDRKDFLDGSAFESENVTVTRYVNRKFEEGLMFSEYGDMSVPIGYRQTCSQPAIVALMAYLLELKKGMRVYEVGSGCGYSAAVALHLIEPGHLVTVEIIPELAALAKRNLEAHISKQNLESRLKVIREDGSAGLEEESPFDRIYLTAGVKNSFDPLQLARHLKHESGILLFPQERGPLIKQVYENGTLVNESPYENVTFVPLVGKNS